MRAILLGPAQPLQGGIANFNESLGIAFIKNSIEIDIVSYSAFKPAFLFPEKTAKSGFKLPDNIKIKSLLNPLNPITWMRTARYISKMHPDVLVVQYWHPFLGLPLGIVIRLLGLTHKSKIIAVVHNLEPKRKNFIYSWFSKLFIQSCDGFVTLSKSMLDRLSDFTANGNKMFVPHPVYDIFGDIILKPDARSFLKLPEHERIILFFGTVKNYKGLDLLLDAMGKEKVRGLNLKLLVAGEFYEDKRKYLKKIVALGLKDNIILTNRFIPGEDVKYYFCSADLIVQPYLSAVQSGVTQIAYNFERPMLVTRVGGLEEIVFHNRTGYVVDINANAIAEALVDFYHENREIQFSINVALEQYRFSWHAVVDGIMHMANFR